MFNNTNEVEVEFASESGTAVYTSAANSINAYTESNACTFTMVAD